MVAGFIFAKYWQKGFVFALLLFFARAQADSSISLIANPTNNISSFAILIQKEFKIAREKFQKNPTNSEAAWQFGRASFDLADIAANNSEREKIATQGISACRNLVSRETNSVPGHYYLGMNLAQLARTKTFGALRILDEMEVEFRRTRELDPQFDFAGADRNLGMIYNEAPGSPISIGDKSKARQHLERAVKLSPEFPENRIYLIEAELKWGDKKSAVENSKGLEKLLPDAKKKFSGEKWSSSWDDWEKRLRKIKSKLPI